MEFNEPAGANPIDVGSVVGKPHNRIEGYLKVTGKAPYPLDYSTPRQDTAYGVIRTSEIALGRIASIDTKEAEAAPGVLLVLTHLNAPRQPARGPQIRPQLQGPDIRSAGQSVALVVAETFEQARAAAHLVRIRYDSKYGAYDLQSARAGGVPVPGYPDNHQGDFEGAIAAAQFRVDATYTTPDESAAMIEPHASLAVWEGDALTVFTSHQILHRATAGIAGTLGIPLDKLRVVSAYIGGAFGGKLDVFGDSILAALAARRLGRPVRVALTRSQIFNHTTHRPATIQRIQLACGPDGLLSAIGHETWSGDQLNGGFSERASRATRVLYGSKNRLIETRLCELNLPFGGHLRGPGDAVGMLALESAMDELAVQTGTDPVALRIRNDVGFDPEKGPSRPFSSRNLAECLASGAKGFGWSKRNDKPRSVRDGRYYVGMGVASAYRVNAVQSSGARVRLGSDGILVIESQQTDLGTGSYTVLAAVGAEMLGLPIDRVTVRLGDSEFPAAAGSAGSWGTNSSSSGVYAACVRLRELITEKAGFEPSRAVFQNGRVRDGRKSRSLESIIGYDELAATETITFGDLNSRFAQGSFGAHFAEVGVDVWTGEVRVRRVHSTYAAGRILNPKTARSQCLGGTIMGIGAALMEDLVVDKRFGYFVNQDLAGYHVPVHGDIPEIEVSFIDELDNKSSPMKAKGLGEVSICGVGAAIANAVYNACGARIREFPLTMDKVLPYLPDLETP